MWTRTFLFFTIFAVGGLGMDRVRVETRVDDAIAKYGVTGKGVIFGMLDRGIDWQNNDFRNEDGTTRIAYIFDLTDDTGANDPGNKYKFGTIYTRAQIDQALRTGQKLATRDADGHGTATTAIAAGNGRNIAGRKYRGIAPNVTIGATHSLGDCCSTCPRAPRHPDRLSARRVVKPTGRAIGTEPAGRRRERNGEFPRPIDIA